MTTTDDQQHQAAEERPRLTDDQRNWLVRYHTTGGLTRATDGHPLCDEDEHPFPCPAMSALAELDHVRAERDRLRAALFVRDHFPNAHPADQDFVSCRLCDATVVGTDDRAVQHDATCILAEQQQQPARPCPGYVPTGHVCERCGRAPEEHRHDRLYEHTFMLCY